MKSNLDLVLKYLGLMSSGKLDEALAMTSDDIRFGGPDGSHQYHLIFEVSSGVIVAMREYCDTNALKVFQE